MALKILYHEDSLADLEEIFEWSSEKHPETTEQFAGDLFDHIELLRALPYIGTPIKGHPQLRRLLHCPLYVYYRLDENSERTSNFILTYEDPRSNLFVHAGRPT